MSERIRMIESGAFNVSAIVGQLSSHPEIWNEIKLRTEHPRSPHREVDDVWVRYNPLENYHGDMQEFNGPHKAKWYPVAEKLPAIREVSEALSERLGLPDIGFVLITRVQPGKQVYPHVDQGWHARNFDKFCIQVKGNQDQAFHFEDGELRAEPGDVYWFNNAFPHWVTNNSASERISLIVCLRR